jgi:hypothetical protein
MPAKFHFEASKKAAEAGPALSVIVQRIFLITMLSFTALGNAVMRNS